MLLINKDREYRQLLVVREPDLDSDCTASMAAAESRLWEEVSRFHIALAHDGLPTPYANAAYQSELKRRQDQVFRRAVRDVLDGQVSAHERAQLLHGYRRTLAILQQEEELMDMPDPCSCAIAEDRAFLALGRRWV